MYSTTFTTNTPRTKILIHLKAVLVDSYRLTRFENKHICQPNCHNYNRKWSCPPHNLTFAQYAQGYPYAIVVLFYCNLNQFDYIQAAGMRKRTANTVIKSRLIKFMRLLEKETDGKLIASSSCQLCKPCTRKSGTFPYCKKPQEMRYSLDSLGLDVTILSSTLFNHQIPHHSQKASLPYTSAVAIVLLKNHTNLNSMIKIKR